MLSFGMVEEFKVSIETNYLDNQTEKLSHITIGSVLKSLRFARG